MPAASLRYLLPLALSLVHGASLAGGAQERLALDLLLRQLDTLEVIAQRSEASAMPSERYRFDYPRLHQDLQRIRQGVRGYLSPSRAQPRDPGELIGDYRLDGPQQEPAP